MSGPAEALTLGLVAYEDCAAEARRIAKSIRAKGPLSAENCEAASAALEGFAEAIEAKIKNLRGMMQAVGGMKQ